MYLQQEILKKKKVLSTLFKSVLAVENASNTQPMGMRCHSSINILDVSEKIFFKELTDLNISKLS